MDLWQDEGTIQTTYQLDNPSDPRNTNLLARFITYTNQSTLGQDGSSIFLHENESMTIIGAHTAENGGVINTFMFPELQEIFNTNEIEITLDLYQKFPFTFHINNVNWLSKKDFMDIISKYSTKELFHMYVE